MIYNFPETSSPIGQGDIFFGVPILDLTDDELPTIDDEGNARALPWEAFASAGENVSAIVSVRPTIAIVGTQECDALRAPNITLFEVRPFRDVERMSKDTSKPSGWVKLLTQHARINQKWFYLPADERIGFNEKMGADFLTPIRVPRLALERLISFRKGRLNEVAKQHFRERLAEFFRRYAYDEWYPLTREELAEYQKNHPDVEPFPWQRENPVPNREREQEKAPLVAIAEYKYEKGLLDYLVEGEEAASELVAILSTLDLETRKVTAKVNQHVSRLTQLNKQSGVTKASDYKKVMLLASSDMNTFSNRIADILPKFESNNLILDESFSAYVSLLNTESADSIDQMRGFRDSLAQMLSVVTPAKESVSGFRDSALSLKEQNVIKEVNKAATRQSHVLEGVISNIEQVESFALRVIFLINERLENPPISEDSTE
jgi:hypothetical protein